MTLPGYATKALTLHNSFRAQHNVSPLEWNTGLHVAAKKYAAQLLTRKPGEKLAHKSDLTSKWGQNVFELRSPVKWLAVPEGTAVEKAIRSWYKGNEVYNWNNPTLGLAGTDKSSLNFSQVVWAETRKVGVGVAVSQNGDTAVVVAFYDPPGNIRGQFQSNVMRAGQSGSESYGRREPSSSSSSYSRPSSTSNATTSSSYRSTITSTRRERESSAGFDEDEDLPLPLAVAVELHNQYRTKHGAPALKLDYKLCERANQYATSLAMGKGPPTGSLSVGCSVYRTENPNIDPVEAVRLAVTKWYSQSKQHNWLAPMSSKLESKLFAQLIFKSTREFGIGLAAHGNAIAVVALYSPAANLSSEQSFRDNVQPSLYF